MIRVLTQKLVLVLVLTLSWLPDGRPVLAEQPVELELLLAVDVSSSVDRREYGLQMDGLAAAFRSRALQAALRQAGPRGIAVALAQWSSDDDQVLALDWTLVRGAADAVAFAALLDQTPRVIAGGGTSLRGALAFAGAQFERNGWSGMRRVIDVSGDGGGVRLTLGKPNPVRDRLVARGFTINGLAIVDQERHLAQYYRDNLIGGPGAFVVTAAGFEDFARAILKKLIQEIRAPSVATLSPR